MKSIAFPKIFNSTTVKVISDHEATMSNLKLLLMSDKGGLFGDPYYGTIIKTYMFDQNNYVLRDIVVDAIYTAILQFMPQIQVDRKDITVNTDRYKLFINIKALNMLDYQTDLYNIVLADNNIN